jgi:hypothetical protein
MIHRKTPVSIFYFKKMIQILFFLKKVQHKLGMIIHLTNHLYCEVQKVINPLIPFFLKNNFRIYFSASSRRELYSLGVIDILTYYGMKKKSAHVAKTKLSGSDADGISTVRPEIYARRFLDFIDKHFL